MASKIKLEKTKQNSFEVNFNDLNATKVASQLFKNNGFVVLRNIINPHIIKRLRKDLLDVVLKQKITNELRDIHLLKNNALSSAHNINNYLPSYKELTKDKKLGSFAQSIFGEVSKKHFNSSYFAKPKLFGLETKAHQDNAYFCMEPPEVVTFWFPVTFANKKTGCLNYYPGSHILGNLEHLPEGNLGASMCLSPKSLSKVHESFIKVFIELNIGDCIAHNSLIAHGSEKNLSNLDRNSFNFSIASKKAVKNKKLFNLYKSKLLTFLNNKKMKDI